MKRRVGIWLGLLSLLACLQACSSPSPDGGPASTSASNPWFDTQEVLFRVADKQTGKVGYVDINGDIRIPCQYPTATQFNNGVAIGHTSFYDDCLNTKGDVLFRENNPGRSLRTISQGQQNYLI